ncbi:MAG: pyridoxamine 5'-phosphate oxidase family protein [Gaiellaceae bacterium]
MVPGSRREERDVLSEALVRELLAARLIAKLATLDADGSVHLVGMWFVWDGTSVLLPTSGVTRKARNLERDPRATVMIDDSRGGFDLRGITLVGRAEVVRGQEALGVNRRIHLKYLTEGGRELAAVDRYLSTDDVTIRFSPERASSWDLRSTEQGRAVVDSGAFHRLY